MACTCLPGLRAVGRLCGCLAALSTWLCLAAAGRPLVAAQGVEPHGGSPMSPRRLVLCLDGTSNNDYNKLRRDQGQEVLKPTNVLKTCRAVMPWDERSGREQISYYDVGVGSLTRYPGGANRALYAFDRSLGGAWGAGFEGNVERALTFIVLNHQPGDEVFLFGFSRGAATARGVTRFIDWAGGLPRKQDAYYLPFLFQGFIHGRGQLPVDGFIRELNAQSDAEKKSGLGPLQPITVEYLGVWDTVMALGSRFKATGGSTTEVSKSFYLDKQPAGCVRHARQALAVDEARFDFRPEIWTAAREGQFLEQRWFAGVHSNVGGGYVHDGLANLAFRWILKGAEDQGLAVDPQFVKFYLGFPYDRMYRSESLLYRVLDRLRWSYGRGKRELLGRPATANLSLDPSVIYRIRADPKAIKKGGGPADLAYPQLEQPYRPQNVLAFLACQPNLDEYLRGIGVDEERRELPADVLQQIGKLRQNCSK
jgi:uncharacterized protein (DUF2235 family)